MSDPAENGSVGEQHDQGFSPGPVRREVWIVSARESFRERLGDLLGSLPVNVLKCGALPDHRLPACSKGDEAAPGLVVLDVGPDLEKGAETLGELRRRRIKAPVVAFTREMSRDFGEKIISQGVGYYFTDAFSPDEFLEVSRNLLHC